MALPADFGVFIAPQDARQDQRWKQVVHEQRAAYQPRFFIHGYPQAADTLGFQNARSLWGALQAARAREVPHLAPRLSADLLDAALVRAIATTVPPRWKSDIPDLNDRGGASAHHTYWREFSLPRLSLSWQAKAQTLPKALLAVAALAVAAVDNGKLPQEIVLLPPVRIRPSLYFLADYSAAMHDRYIAPDLATQRTAYAACGLEFEFGWQDYSDALRQAADGRATLTFATATRLRGWLLACGAPCGEVMINRNADRFNPAAEVFADAEIALDAVALIAVAGGAARR